MSKYQVKTIDGKMMLISRDIQVGDKVRSDYDGHSELEGTYDKVEGAYSYFTNPQGKQVMWLTKEEVPLYIFKVIGEISPDATFLQENQELSEEDVIIYGDEPRRPENTIVRVKCPCCGTFK